MGVADTYSYYFRIINAIALVGFSIALLIAHRYQYYVDTVCTAYDTPAGCAADTEGGYYRAYEMLAPTTSLYPDIKPSTQYPSLPYYAYVYPTTITNNHTYSFCTTKYSADAEKLAACKAEKIQSLLEMSNRNFYRSLWTVSGGVHIWYFIWLSLWVSASFAVIMLPGGISVLGGPYVGTDNFKLAVLMFWHLGGIILSIMFYVDDDYFRMRLPLNNVVLGCVVHFFTIIIQMTWVRNVEFKLNNVTQMNNFKGSYVGIKDSHVGIKSLMFIGAGEREEGESNKKPDVRSTDVRTQWNVYDSKWSTFQLSEATLMEIAITVPLLAVAVFCIGSRVNADWYIQALLIRCFLAFFIMAVVSRIIPFIRHTLLDSQDKAFSDIGHYKYVFVTSAVTLYATVFTAVYFLVDWYVPVNDVSLGFTHSTRIFISGIDKITILSYIILVVLFAIYVFEILFAVVRGNLSDDTVYWFEEIVHNIAHAFIFVLRFIAFLCAISPILWYEAVDRKDVLFNYG